MSSGVPTQLLSADKAVKVRKENLLELVDNDVFLRAIDKAYSNKAPNREIDREKVILIKECVRATTRTAPNVSLRKSIFYKFQENGCTLTQESWESCIEYYEDRMDQLYESGADINKLRETETWLAGLYEPVDPDDYDACYEWCVFQYKKILKGMSGYTPPRCVKMLSCVLPSSLPKEWFDTNASIVAHVANHCEIRKCDLKKAYDTACKTV